MFGVRVNFRVKTLQRPAVQLCGEMELGRGRGEGQLL